MPLIRRRLRTLAALGLFGALGVLVASCTLLNPLDGYTSDLPAPTPEPSAPRDTAPPPQPDTSTDAPADAACTRRLPPERPPTSMDPGSSSHVLAADTLEYGNAEEGYDLDGLCTCPGAAACVVAAKPTPSCDAPQGVDNVLGPLLSASLALFPNRGDGGDVSGSEYIRAGTQTVLILLRGFNNTANDDKVQVGLLGSGPLAALLDGGAAVAPKLDGTDVWSIEEDSVVGKGASGPPYEARAIDNNAFVRDGLLVATLDLDFRIGLFRARAKEARLTARVVREGANLRLRDGLLTGRVLAGDLLTGLEILKSPLTGRNLCRDEPLYVEAKRRICEALDLPVSRVDDGQGTPCGAISLSLRFSAITAALGPLTSGAQPRPCGIDWSDDCPR